MIDMKCKHSASEQNVVKIGQPYCVLCKSKNDKKELKIIKASIKEILKYVLNKNGKERFEEVMKNQMNDYGFPMLVENIVFFTFRDKKPPVISTGWADRPRVTLFHRAWTELKLPPYKKSVFHE